MKISNGNVYNLENAIRASKYPMAVDVDKLNSEVTDTVKKLGSQPRGSAHDNFLNGVVVSFDLTCSNKMWVEFERYHFAEIISGQSTMHRVKQIVDTMSDDNSPFNDYVHPAIVNVIMYLANKYEEDPTAENYLELLYNIPSGLELTDHIVTNYGQLKTMWYQRHNHRLPEWRVFCDWILTLPKFCELTGIVKGEENNAKN